MYRLRHTSYCCSFRFATPDLLRVGFSACSVSEEAADRSCWPVAGHRNADFFYRFEKPSGSRCDETESRCGSKAGRISEGGSGAKRKGISCAYLATAPGCGKKTVEDGCVPGRY